MPQKLNNIFVFISSHLNISLSELLYNIYDAQLSNIIKPIVVDIAKTREGCIENFAKDNEAVAAKLFELYRELKTFSDYGMEIYGNCDFKMNAYPFWFANSVDKRSKGSVFAAALR